MGSALSRPLDPSSLDPIRGILSRVIQSFQSPRCLENVRPPRLPCRLKLTTPQFLRLHPDAFENTYKPLQPIVSLDCGTFVPVSQCLIQEKRKAAEELPDERPAKRASTWPSHLACIIQSGSQPLKAKRKAPDELHDERPTKKPLIEAAHSGQSSTPVSMRHMYN
jgi:hypothetical protein